MVLVVLSAAPAKKPDTVSSKVCLDLVLAVAVPVARLVPGGAVLVLGLLLLPTDDDDDDNDDNGAAAWT